MDFKRIKTFFNNHFIIRNLTTALLVAMVVFILVFVWLRIYTRHGEAFSVPDLTGMTLEEVKEILPKRKLNFEIFDSIFSDEYTRGTVVEQHPKPGFKVKKNRKIFLTMNAINREKVIVPNLVDLTIRQARSRLKSFGLRVGQVSYQPDIGVNIVLAQKYKEKTINEGDTIVKGSYIDLVLGKGLSNVNTRVPDLIGLTLEEATLKATDAFLRIGAAVADPGTMEKDMHSAIIYRQRPEHNKKNLIPLGSSIDVWTTLDSTKLLGRYSDTLYYENIADTAL